MRERNKIILEYGTYMLSFFVSYIASLAKWYYASGIILIVEAVYLYVHWVRESGSFVELRALFTLAWVGGQGISCLKLSTLQDTWSYITWLSFFVIYIAFGIGNLLNVLDPEIIVIGGGVALAGEILFNGVNEKLKKYALPSTLEGLRILPAKLGNDAGIIGAAYLGMM